MKKTASTIILFLSISLATAILSTLIFLVCSGAFGSLLDVVEENSAEEQEVLANNSLQVVQDDTGAYATISKTEIEKAPKASNCQFVYGEDKTIRDLFELDAYGVPDEAYNISYIVFAKEKTVILSEAYGNLYPTYVNGNAVENVRNGRATQFFCGEKAKISDLFFQVENGGTEVFYKTDRGNFVRCYPKNGNTYWEFEEEEYFELQMKCKSIADNALGRDSGADGMNLHIDIFAYLEKADQGGLLREHSRQTDEQSKCIPKIYGVLAVVLVLACIVAAVVIYNKRKKATPPQEEQPPTEL